MWRIVASRSIRKPPNPPILSTVEGYGAMQKSLNDLHEVGYRKFDIEETDS